MDKLWRKYGIKKVENNAEENMKNKISLLTQVKSRNKYNILS